MSKTADISDIVTGFNSASTLNSNFSRINTALENTVSLDGSTPNAMQADLDLNGFDLLNVKSLYLNGQKTTGLATVPDWQGQWVSSTSYFTDDIIRQDGSVYIALEDHTSSTFSADLSASKWELFASKGSSGDGTGDLISTNNLSDLTDTSAAKTNLGLGTVATLDVVDEDGMDSNSSSLVPTQQSVKAYVDTRPTPVLDEDDMSSDSDTQAPSQQSVKAYVDNSVPQILDEDDFSSNSSSAVPTQQSVKAYVDSSVDIETGVGEVGTYALLGLLSGNASPGSTHLASDLRYADASGSRAGSPSGTWQAMGRATGNSSGDSGSVTLFVRVS